MATGSAKRSEKRANAAKADFRPAAAAEQRDRALGGPQQLLQSAHIREARPALNRLEGGGVGHRDALGEHVLRQRDHHRPRPAVAGGMEGARDQFGNAGGIVDFGHPFGDRAEHRTVVEFLKRLAVPHVAPDLSDEHDHRRRILPRDMNAGTGIGGTRPARDKADAGSASGLADRLGHHGGSALMAADGERDLAVMKRVKRGEIAFARHTEHVLHAVNRQLVDQDFAASAGAVIRAHRVTPRAPAPLRFGMDLRHRDRRRERRRRH